MSDASLVDVYLAGGLSCSVCVPADWPRERIEEAVNVRHPCATPPSELRWKIADDKTFKGGEPNPCPCDQATGRLHYFMDC